MACIISAPSSNSGKTLVSLIISAWARNQGLSLQTFKVGPDYLDPQQLTAVSAKPCRNLDLVLCGKKWVKESFYGFGSRSEFSLIEGVMGLFDGIGVSQEGSTAAVARYLNLPIVLVIDARGQAGSLGALVKGFINHDPKLNFAGVILNHVNSTRHKELLLEVLNTINVKLLGVLPTDPQLVLPSQHLGLAPVHEFEKLEAFISPWASIAEENLDLTQFRALLKSPKSNHVDPIKSLIKENKKTKSYEIKPVAVAQDKAFHFRYPETKECLEALGMPVIPWRLVEDEPIPTIAKGLIIPGGFPELFASRISQCRKSLKDLSNWFMKKPIYAECGGMLILGESLSDTKGNIHSMAGLLPFHAKQGKLKVGYRSLRCSNDSLIVRSGYQFMGHEFHRWDIERTHESNNLNLISQNCKDRNKLGPIWEKKGWNSIPREEGWSNKNLHASWIHLHWASCPQISINWRKALDRN